MSSVEISFSLTSYTENTPHTVDNWNATTGTDNLTNMIIATVVEWDSSSVSALEGKSIEELIAMAPYNLGGLNADQELDLYIEWTLDTTATNGCQGDSLDLTVELVGNQ